MLKKKQSSDILILATSSLSRVPIPFHTHFPLVSIKIVGIRFVPLTFF